MNITVVGTGFVGVVSAAVYASLGHQVIGLDIDQQKIESLKLGKVPFFEPDLEELLTQQQAENRLSFTTDYPSSIANADLIIVAVGTPSLPSGAIDLKYVKQTCIELAPHLKNQAIVAIKSTVPSSIFKEIKPLISQHTSVEFALVALPEFLKEGTAVHDTLYPDRVVIGSDDQATNKILSDLFQPLNSPLVVVKPESAQMIKYVSNAYLATRITFINQMADLCEHNQADIEDVIQGIGYDKRIGHHYWYPGLGYGGSCFPKDVNELAAYAQDVGEIDNLAITISRLNENRIPRLLSKYEKKLGGWNKIAVAVLGLAFKPNTNDTREAPALRIIPEILTRGAIVKAYDPKAVWQPDTSLSSYQQLESIDETIINSDVIMILVEWAQIINYEFPQIDRPCLFIDTRNQFNPEKITELGYTYQGIGR